MLPSSRQANMATVQALQRHGWYLTSAGIAECTENGKNNVNDIMKAALDLDLKDIGEKHLPDLKNKLDHVDGPFVLQIQKLRNITAPKDNEESQAAPRLFKLTLTDGHVSCPAIEMDSIDKINLNTPPGTKLKLLSRVPVSQGFLLLNSSSCVVLGGRVDKLVDNWELKRMLAKQSRLQIQADGGPPPFIPFGLRKREEQQHVPLHHRKETFKSLAQSKEKKEDTEFEQQRKAVIDKALQAKEGTKSKVFGGQKQVSDRDIAKIVEMGFTPEQATKALRETNNNVQEAIHLVLQWSDNRGNYGNNNRNYGDRGSLREQRESRDTRSDRSRGRRAKAEEEFDDLPSKPSAPATLFDFLTSKIPSGEPRGISNAKVDNREDNQTEGHRSHSASESDSSGKRGPQNLPPRLLKQQQRREEQRQRNVSGGHSSNIQKETSPPALISEQSQSSRSQQGQGRSVSLKGHDHHTPSNVTTKTDDFRGQRSNDSRNQKVEDYSHSYRQGEQRSQRSNYTGQNEYKNQRHEEFKGQKLDRNQRLTEYVNQRSNDYRNERSDSNRNTRINDYGGQRFNEYRGQRSDNYRGSRGRGQQFSSHHSESRSRDKQGIYDTLGKTSSSNPTKPDWINNQDTRRPHYNDGRQGNRVHRGGDGQPSSQDITGQQQIYQDNANYCSQDQGLTKNLKSHHDSSTSDKSTKHSKEIDGDKERSGSHHQKTDSMRYGESAEKSRKESGINSTITRSSAPSGHVNTSGSSFTQQQQAISTSHYDYVVSSAPNIIQSQAQMSLNGDLTMMAMHPPNQPIQGASMTLTQQSTPTYDVPQQVLQHFQGIHITGPPPVQTFLPGGGPTGHQGYVQPTYMSVSSTATLSSDYASRQKYTTAKQVDNRGPPLWKVGDYCLAKYYQDNKFYQAVIQSVGANNQSYLVTFPGYGNTEEISANDIRPLQIGAWDTNTMQSPGGAGSIVSQGSLVTMTLPMTVAAGGSSGVPGMMIQSPAVSYVPAFPTDQPYQGTVTNLEFHQASAASLNYQSSSAPILVTRTETGI